MDESLFIPRSSIAAFGQSPDVVAALSELKSHPLLTRAHYEQIEGGLNAIINKYPSGGTPDLIILQHDGPIEDLDRLAEVSAATTQLIIISRDNDISRYRKLLDQGGADYLFTPVTTELLLASISRAFARAENRQTGTLVTFISCGGGSGGSTIAQNAAVLLSQIPNKRAMLLDFDIYTGSVTLNFDVHPVKGLRDLLRDPKSISAKEILKLAQERSASLQILCSPPTLEPGFALKADHFIDILDHARTLVDFVVIDMPGSWSLLHNKMLAMSERVGLVATPTLSSFQVMRNILDLSAKLRTNLPAQDLVLNRWSTTTEKQISSAVFAETLRGGRMFKVAECDEEIVTAGGTALTLAELKPRPAALQELSDYCAMIAGVLDQHGSEDRPSLIKRLFGSKRS
jgi:pilus assembly protein CpaE